MELKTTRWQAEAGIGLITLSRPASHNAWTGRMHTELRHLLGRAEDDPSIRVVVITGDPAGGTFCPGADIKALEIHADRGVYDPGTPEDLANPGYGLRDEFDADFAFFLGLETIIIAAMNGAAAGVGLALACWCDIRFAAEGAKLTAAHGKLNIPAEYGLSWLLPKLIGRSRAADILLSSRIVLSEEAERIGLVNRVLPADEVADEALEYARSLVAEVSPSALRTTKRQLSIDMIHNDPGASVRDAQSLMNTMMAERDYREATEAFTSKRPAEWRDR